MIIAFDIDGVCTEDFSTHWNDPAGSYTYRKASERTKTVMDQLMKQGHTVIVYTGRDEIWRPMTERWLRMNGFRYHFLFFGKLPFSLLVDDRARSLPDLEMDLGVGLGETGEPGEKRKNKYKGGSLMDRTWIIAGKIHDSGRIPAKTPSWIESPTHWRINLIQTFLQICSSFRRSEVRGSCFIAEVKEASYDVKNLQAAFELYDQEIAFLLLGWKNILSQTSAGESHPPTECNTTCCTSCATYADTVNPTTGKLEPLPPPDLSDN